MKRTSGYGLRLAGGALAAVLMLGTTPALANGGEGQNEGGSRSGDHHGGGDHPKPAPQGTVCGTVAKDAWRACQHDARSSFWLAVARCDNAGVTAPPKSLKGKHLSKHGSPAGQMCRKSAASDLRDGASQCSEQLGARQDVCDLLGGGPYAPVIDPASFSTTIDNPLLPLSPGTTFVYEGPTAAGLEHDEIVVTSNTREIMGVTCLAVHDTVKTDGEVTEDTTDWFAQDSAGNVWYFGEDSRQFEGGFLSGTEGSWLAGVDGALPGIIMEASPAVDDVYRQEFAIGTAEDMAQVVALDQSVSVPFGSFTNALETLEFSALEPGATEHKFYVPGVGFVLSIDDQTGDRLELISTTTVTPVARRR